MLCLNFSIELYNSLFLSQSDVDFDENVSILMLGKIEPTSSLQRVFKHIAQKLTRFALDSVDDTRQSLIKSVRIDFADNHDVERKYLQNWAKVAQLLVQKGFSFLSATSAALRTCLGTWVAVFCHSIKSRGISSNSALLSIYFFWNGSQFFAQPLRVFCWTSGCSLLPIHQTLRVLVNWRVSRLLLEKHFNFRHFASEYYHLPMQL